MTREEAGSSAERGYHQRRYLCPGSSLSGSTILPEGHTRAPSPTPVPCATLGPRLSLRDQVWPFSGPSFGALLRESSGAHKSAWAAVLAAVCVHTTVSGNRCFNRSLCIQCLSPKGWPVVTFQAGWQARLSVGLTKYGRQKPSAVVSSSQRNSASVRTVKSDSFGPRTPAVPKASSCSVLELALSSALTQIPACRWEVVTV